MDFTEGVFSRITSKPKSIRAEINESTRRKRKSILRREIEEAQTILRMTGRAAKFPMVCALSLLLFLVGAAFALALGNFFLMPVLAVGMMFVPFWFIKLTANHYKKNIAAELETALSIITTAYLRNEDIQTAVEENLDYLNPPVKNVFAEFLTRIKLVDPDVDAALQDMGTKIDNAVFREWVAALLTCRHDRAGPGPRQYPTAVLAQPGLVRCPDAHPSGAGASGGHCRRDVYQHCGGHQTDPAH